MRLEVLQRLTHRAGQVDSVEVGALTKPEDAFARKDPAKMTPAEYDRWYCTPYVSSIAHQIEEVLPMAVARPIRRVADNEGQVLEQDPRADAADLAGGAGFGGAHGVERDGDDGAGAARRDRHHAGHRRGQLAGGGPVRSRGRDQRARPEA